MYTFFVLVEKMAVAYVHQMYKHTQYVGGCFALLPVALFTINECILCGWHNYTTREKKHRMQKKSSILNIYAWQRTEIPWYIVVAYTAYTEAATLHACTYLHRRIHFNLCANPHFIKLMMQKCSYTSCTNQSGVYCIVHNGRRAQSQINENAMNVYRYV